MTGEAHAGYTKNWNQSQHSWGEQPFEAGWCRHCFSWDPWRGPGKGIRTPAHLCVVIAMRKDRKESLQCSSKQTPTVQCANTADSDGSLQVVEALTQGGPAEASEKLRTGDVLESIDGSPVAKMTDRTFPSVVSCALVSFRLLLAAGETSRLHTQSVPHCPV